MILYTEALLILWVKNKIKGKQMQEIKNVEIKELNPAERLNSRLNICMDKYIEVSDELNKMFILTYRRLRVIKKSKSFFMLTDKEKMAVNESLRILDNMENITISKLPESEFKGNDSDFIKNFIETTTRISRELSGILAEIWLIVGLAVEVDDSVKEFMDIAFTGEEFSKFKTILDSIDAEQVNDVKGLYMDDPKLALKVLRDIVAEKAGTNEIKTKVKNEVKEMDKKVKNEVKEMDKKVNDKVKKKKKKTSTSSYNGSGMFDNMSTTTKVVGGVLGLLAVGYVGKKVYDHFNSDDIVVIDSAGMDFSDNNSFTNNW
jgi:hypothetical protein